MKVTIDSDHYDEIYHPPTVTEKLRGESIHHFSSKVGGAGSGTWGRTYSREPAKTSVTRPGRTALFVCQGLRRLLFAAAASPAWLWRAGLPRVGTPRPPRPLPPLSSRYYRSTTNSDVLTSVLSFSAVFINNFSSGRRHCGLFPVYFPISVPGLHLCLPNTPDLDLTSFVACLRVHDIVYICIPSGESRRRVCRCEPDLKIVPNWNYLKGVVAASCVKFGEILCDLSVPTFSPDGQVFHV